MTKFKILNIRLENEFFTREKDIVYRNELIFKEGIDKKGSKVICKDLIKTNHARVLYDTSNLDIIEVSN